MDSSAIYLDCRHYMEAMQSTRAMVNELRRLLDEWDEVCERINREATPELLEQVEKRLNMMQNASTNAD